MTGADPSARIARAPSSGALWALALGGFLVNADNRSIAPMLPAMAQALHVTAATAGLLVTAYSLPYGLFQLVYGPLADAVGKVRTIVAAVCLFGLGTILCGAVQGFTWLMVLRVLTGIFAAGIIPTTLAYIGDTFPPASRPRAIAFFMSMTTTGQVLGIVVGGLLAQFVSYRVLFILLGLAAFPALLAMRRPGTGEARVHEHRDPPAARHRFHPEGARHRFTPTEALRRYTLLLRSARAWGLYGLVFCEGFAFYGGFTFLGVFGVNQLHLSYLVIGLLTALYSLGALVGSRTIAVVLSRVGARRMPVLGAALMTLGYALVWAWPSVAALAAGFVVLGFGFSYCHSTLQTFATELLPEGRATAVSVFAFSLFLGSGVGPMVTGTVMDHHGLRSLLAVATLAMAAFTLLCLTLWRRQRSPSVFDASVSG